MKKVLILGASGSIGKQTIDVIDNNLDRFDLVAFSVGHNDAVIDDIIITHPNINDVYLISDSKRKHYEQKYPEINFYSGKKGLKKLVQKVDYDICVDALVGFVGLEPAYISLKRNKILCLANKEALVSGGDLIKKVLKKGTGKLYPIDSEHVAIAKCISKANNREIEKLIITASGGALRNVPLEKLNDATPEDALKHPNWRMGDKITIDCATMMNKGFEIIEAYYLFDYPLSKINVLMHDESLVHSLIQLENNKLIVDYGKPDMHGPIEYALFEGKNKFDVLEINNLNELSNCHFHDYNPKRYPLTELAKECLKNGASKMIALNAANEVAVNKFLKHEIHYNEIYDIVKKVVDKTPLIKHPSLFLTKLIDKKARKEANKC